MQYKFNTHRAHYLNEFSKTKEAVYMHIRPMIGKAVYYCVSVCVCVGGGGWEYIMQCKIPSIIRVA